MDLARLNPVVQHRGNDAAAKLVFRVLAVPVPDVNPLDRRGDVAYGLRQSFQPGTQGVAHSCRIAIGPGCFDQRPPRAPVARQGEALPSDRIAGRALRWDQTEENQRVGLSPTGC